MGFADKAKISAEQLAGKAKEVIGSFTDQDDLKAEGKADQARAKAKKAGEDVKDVFKD